jgi:hypothetical protein
MKFNFEWVMDEEIDFVTIWRGFLTVLFSRCARGGLVTFP